MFQKMFHLDWDKNVYENKAQMEYRNVSAKYINKSYIQKYFNHMAKNEPTNKRIQRSRKICWSYLFQQ